jgi:hypothetical protein
MIRTLTAQTLEIDDPEAAVAEILAQLDLGRRLLKNSVGIIACPQDFIEEGIVKALCNKLPFETVGITTLAAASPEGADQAMLGITVFTSGEVSFAAGLSKPLQRGREDLVGELYDHTAACLPEKPSLILLFSAFITNLSGDALVRVLDRASGEAPVFGTLAIDMSTGARPPRIIFNGEAWNDRMGLILLAGDFEPAFSVTSISKNKGIQQQTVITKSRENMILEINGMPVGAWFEATGLAPNGTLPASVLGQIPLLLDYDDQTGSVTRSILTQAPEGYLVCAGDVPENCSLSLGSLEARDLVSASAAAAQTLAEEGRDGILLFSCAARNFALGLDYMAEIDAIRRELGPGRRYMFAYSGGEFCPVKTQEGKLKNRFHNATLISCSLARS